MKESKPKKVNSPNRKPTQSKVGYEIGSFDLPFFVLVCLLLIFGLIMVFSASYPSAFYNHGDSFFYIKKQLLSAAVGFVAMMALSNFDYRIYKKFKIPQIAIITAILLLVAVLVVGVEGGGAKRWLKIGPVQFQPSELTKLAVIVSFAYYISKYSDYMKKVKTGILPYIGILGVISILMVLEPHYSGTILIFAVGVVLIFVGGANWKVLFGTGVAGLSLVGLFIWLTPYAKSRLTSFLDPFSDPTKSGYQIIQSLYAIGSGGLMGLGLGNSRQKFLYLPEEHNDFIFSVICEELGFIGALLVIILFASLVVRGYMIAMKSADKFGCMLCVGIITLIGVQTVLNIGVATNTIPNTGISLPFFSYGGTSLVTLLAEMGIILNISRFTPVKKQG